MDGRQGLALDRRALMQGAILLVGGAIAGVPERAFAKTAPFFAPGERAVLDAACAAMIPRTDTPGALEAEVPAFIDGMMTNWADAATQAQFRAVLAALDASAGKRFATLYPEAREASLAAFDKAAFANGDAGYRRFKELLLTGYYLSEAGATQELRYELAPGVWEPAMPMTPETRAWAT